LAWGATSGKIKCFKALSIECTSVSSKSTVFRVSTPSQSSDNSGVLYNKTDGHLYWKGRSSVGETVLEVKISAPLAAVPDPLRLGKGTVSFPTYSFTLDNNTGMYSPSPDNSNKINFSCNSIAVVEFNTSGINMLGNDNNSYIYGAHLIRTNNGTEDAPSYTFNDHWDYGMYYGGGAVNIAVDGEKELLVGTSSTYIYGYVNIGEMIAGGTYYTKWSTSDGFLYYTTSTRKAKMNIVDLDFDSSKIYQLEPKSFTYRKHRFEGKQAFYTDEPGEKSFGMIAEDVYEALPDLTILDDNGEPGAVDYPLLSVLLLVELKKLKDRIEVLEGN